jgi:hypothetical protein
MAESGNRRVLESPTLSAITKQAPKRSLFGYGGADDIRIIEGVLHHCNICEI